MVSLTKSTEKKLIIQAKLTKTLLKSSNFSSIFICVLVKIQSYERVCQFSKITLQIYFLT